MMFFDLVPLIRIEQISRVLKTPVLASTPKGDYGKIIKILLFNIRFIFQ